MNTANLPLPERLRIEAADGTVLSGPLILLHSGADLVARTGDGDEHLIMADCPYDLSAVKVMVQAWDNNPVNAAYAQMQVPFSLN